METTWQDPELRFLLGEMIKASSLEIAVLVDFIKAHNIEQNWMNMQLPIGRTMQQCMGAAERVLSVHNPTPPNYFNLKRKSIEASEQPLKRQVILPPAESAHPPRNIQPRPSSNGFASTASTTNSPNVSTTGTGKKRGRPSKADKEAQARANSFRTMEYAPITPAPAPTQTPLTSVSMVPQREYVSSPGYEVTGGTGEMKMGRNKIGGNENSPTGITYPLASPASVARTPRGGLDPLEQPPQQQQSPQGYGSRQAADQGPMTNFPAPKHHSPSPGQRSLQPVSQTNTLPPIQAGGSRAPPQQYRSEPPRVIDPIFPDRDRSTSTFDPISRSTPPASSVANRS